MLKSEKRNINHRFFSVFLQSLTVGYLQKTLVLALVNRRSTGRKCRVYDPYPQRVWRGKDKGLRLLNGHFPPDVARHVVSDLVIVGVSGLEIHQFRDRTLHRTVISADDTGRLELVTSIVATHFHASCHALADVHYHLAVACGIFQSLD